MITDTVAAASATVGTNLASGKSYAQSNRWRHFKGMALVGSTNPADCAIDVFSGGVYCGTVRNARGGANLSVQPSTDLQPFDFLVPPNEVLEFKVAVAAVTNAIVWGVDLDFIS